MKPVPAQPANSIQAWFAVWTVTFFVLFFVFLWLVVDPTLLEHTLKPIFLLDRIFLGEILENPGGPVSCASAFLMQFFRWGWLGALIGTTALAGVGYASDRLLRRLHPKPMAFLSLLPCVFLWIEVADYGFPWVDVCLGLVLNFLGTFVYVALPWNRDSHRGGGFLVLWVLLYYVTGGQVHGFALAGVVYEIVGRRRWILGLVLAVAGALLPLAGAWVFILRDHMGYLVKLPVASANPVGRFPWHVFLALPFIVAIGSMIGRRLSQPSLPKEAQPTAHMPQGRKPTQGKVWALWNQPIVPTILGCVLALAGFSWNEKALARIDYETDHGAWNLVLELGRHLPAYSRASVADINRALCQTGRITQDMFAYPQRKDFELWLTLHDTINPRKCMKVGDALIELGQVNSSERMAGEILELWGYRPDALKRLALIKILKGQPESARIYLNLLTKTLFDRRWARETLGELSRDPRLISNPEVIRLRSFMITDLYSGGFDAEGILLQSLRQNRQNRLAFQYLMAHYLLTQQLDKLHLNVIRLGNFNFPEIPRHVEEALVLYRQTSGRALSLHGNRISLQTERRYQEFNQRFLGYVGDLRAASLGMLREFGDTYWYYHVFGCSGMALAHADLKDRL